MDLLEECIQHLSLAQTLRLVTLVAQTAPAGLLRDDMKKFHHLIHQSYGYRSAMLLTTLEVVGLIPVETQRRAMPWQVSFAD